MTKRSQKITRNLIEIASYDYDGSSKEYIGRTLPVIFAEKPLCDADQGYPLPGGRSYKNCSYLQAMGWIGARVQGIARSFDPDASSFYGFDVDLYWVPSVPREDSERLWTWVVAWFAQLGINYFGQIYFRRKKPDGTWTREKLF